MGYVCVEHMTTPATIIITMLEDGTTIGLCGECVHPWAAGIAAATDPEAIQEAKARAVLEGEAERSAEAGTDPLDEPTAEPASVEGWTHPLDRAEAAEAAEAEAPPGPCGACGGTGDLFDKETDDWADPPGRCERCGGSGEAPQEAEAPPSVPAEV